MQCKDILVKNLVSVVIGLAFGCNVPQIWLLSVLLRGVFFKIHLYCASTAW